METKNLKNNFSFSHTQFILFGFPGFSDSRHLLIFPFFSIYVVILSGNSIIVYRIWVEKTLQPLMYSLISLLFVVNISCTTAVMPKFLLGLAFYLNQISLNSCLVQKYFIYFTVMFESSVVIFLALDRYVAICIPLCYHDIMTKHFLVKFIISAFRSVILVSPIVISVSRVHYCNSNIITHFDCENMGLLNLGCGDITKTHIIGLIVRILITVIDGSFLFVSYLQILHSAMKIIIGKSRQKALHTCCTHVIVAMLIYTCGFISSMVYRMGSSVFLDIQNLVGAIYFLFPAAVNPIIYGLRVKEIKLCLQKTYGSKKLKTEGSSLSSQVLVVHHTGQITSKIN
ncbi:olfactory receptor 52Z1P-like [Bombina bombina]|uniref:olfactory receptor 52Z1P-like n=1 Tax=Bombina bombina TaxID=8345 RepID=UPI00235A5A5C|nr:olfactory receptor 52Z1P-like [Bombina bombina]